MYIVIEEINKYYCHNGAKLSVARNDLHSLRLQLRILLKVV